MNIPRKADIGEHRRLWRVLLLTVKAKFVAIENDLSTLEAQFLADVVPPGSNSTIGQQLIPHLDKLGSLPLLPDLSGVAH